MPPTKHLEICVGRKAAVAGIALHLMWYDFFSLFYDRALEDLYAPFRPAAVEALHLVEGATVLDLPCGTGQSFELLVKAVGPTGSIVGLDASSGMLREAERRVDRAGWDQVTLCRGSVADLDAELPGATIGVPQVDGVLCALGLTALPTWESAFEQMYAMLRPGGRFIVFDVYTAKRTLPSRWVELVARADLSREVWRPLEARCSDFRREVLSAEVTTFGGELYVASGTRKVA